MDASFPVMRPIRDQVMQTDATQFPQIMPPQATSIIHQGTKRGVVLNRLFESSVLMICFCFIVHAIKSRGEHVCTVLPPVLLHTVHYNNGTKENVDVRLHAIIHAIVRDEAYVQQKTTKQKQRACTVFSWCRTCRYADKHPCYMWLKGKHNYRICHRVV